MTDEYNYPWDEAPEEAMWAATDQDGISWWYKQRPKIAPCNTRWFESGPHPSHGRIKGFKAPTTRWRTSIRKRPEKKEHTMTNKDEWIKIKQEQIRCMEKLSEEDIGKDVWVRNHLFERYEGPFTLHGFYFTSAYAIHANGHWWRFATKTPPIEPVDIPMIEWHGGEKCPISEGTRIIYQWHNTSCNISVYPEELDWKQITAYAPINPIIREKE